MLVRSRVTSALLIAAIVTSACHDAGASTQRGGEGGAARQDSVRAVAAAGEPAASFPAASRAIADIVAPRWSDEDDRDSAGEFVRVANAAGVRTGMVVADIGAGDGYYVARLSPLVGTRGVVYGEDIIPSYLALLDQRVRKTPLRNVVVARGEPHDPRLPPASLDLAFMIHMYHEITQPYALLWNLASAMKPGGRLVILDLERPTYGHGTPIALLRCELRAVGYRERSVTRTGTEEYVAIFDAPTLATRPLPAVLRAQLGATPCVPSR